MYQVYCVESVGPKQIRSRSSQKLIDIWRRSKLMVIISFLEVTKNKPSPNLVRVTFEEGLQVPDAQ